MHLASNSSTIVGDVLNFEVHTKLKFERLMCTKCIVSIFCSAPQTPPCKDAMHDGCVKQEEQAHKETDEDWGWVS